LGAERLAVMRTVRPPTRRDGRVDTNEPADEIEGDWPRERLEEMDALFVEWVERAISAGREHRLCLPKSA